MPSPESRSHRRAVLEMDYRDDSGSPPVAGNYTMQVISPLTLRGASQI